MDKYSFKMPKNTISSSFVKGVENSTGRKVGIKIFPNSRKSYYDNEVFYLNKLKGNQFVVEILDNFTKNDMHFIVLELGESDLYNFVVVEKNHFDEEQMLSQIILAIYECHKMGITHSDLKLDNFLLVNKRVKLCDFETAFENDNHRLFGTKFMLPPESKTLKRSLPYVCDIWCLGIIHYEIYSRNDALLKKFEIINKDNLSEECMRNVNYFLEKDYKKRIQISDLKIKTIYYKNIKDVYHEKTYNRSENFSLREAKDISKKNTKVDSGISNNDIYENFSSEDVKNIPKKIKKVKSRILDNDIQKNLKNNPNSFIIRKPKKTINKIIKQ